MLHATPSCITRIAQGAIAVAELRGHGANLVGQSGAFAFLLTQRGMGLLEFFVELLVRIAGLLQTRL